MPNKLIRVRFHHYTHTHTHIYIYILKIVLTRALHMSSCKWFSCHSTSVCKLFGGQTLPSVTEFKPSQHTLCNKTLYVANNHPVRRQRSFFPSLLFDFYSAHLKNQNNPLICYLFKFDLNSFYYYLFYLL